VSERVGSGAVANRAVVDDVLPVITHRHPSRLVVRLLIVSRVTISPLPLWNPVLCTGSEPQSTLSGTHSHQLGSARAADADETLLDRYSVHGLIPPELRSTTT